MVRELPLLPVRVYTYRILLAFCHCLLGLTAFSQDARLTYLGIEQGLSNNAVTSIFQDHKGFMWFGTFDGLNCYDGYAFKVYRNQLNDSTSLCANRIVVIEEDKHNNVWIGTKSGVSIYNNTRRGFTMPSFVPCGTHARIKLASPIKDIRTDTSGNVFIATDGRGLLLAKPNSFEATQVTKLEGEQQLCDYSVQAVRMDEHRQVWVFINGRGIYQYDYATATLRKKNDVIRTANCMEADKQGNLWVGTVNGLFKLDLARNEYTTTYLEGPAALTSGRVISIYAVNNRELLIATDGGGVNTLDPSTGQFTYIVPGTGQNTLKSSAVYAVYADREGRTWIGTLRGGVNVLDARTSRFRTLAKGQRTTNTLVNDFVLSFAEEPSGNLWIGTDGGGISYWNRAADVFTSYVHETNNPASLSNNFVTDICRDSHGDVWIATYGGGVNRFNRQRGSFEHYNCANGGNAIAADVWTLYEDKAKNLWAGTVGGLLNLFNRSTNRFEVFDEALWDVISLTEDKAGNLWAGTFNSLIRIDQQNKKHAIYKVNKPVRAILADKDDTLWLATEGYGLLKYTPGKEGFTSYSTEHGLQNPSVLTLLEDDKGDLWMGTFGGLSKFNKTTATFQNFDQSDGLQSNQFNYNAALRLTSGEMLFGGLKGFNLFYPDSIHTVTSAPPVFLTGIRVDNTAVYGDHHFVQQVDADNIRLLRIPYNQANISFEMAALEYSAPEKIKYAYLLEGWDKDWNYAGSQRSAIYSNLREGDYSLKIKTTNSDGIWQPEKTVMEITVLPPWYRSWWAYAGYLLFIIVAGSAYMRYKANQAKIKYELALSRLNADMKKSELEKEKIEREREHAEYERTNAEYQREKAERETERVINEREKEINEKRLSFFTSISHEFRTPLTLIINPVRDLLKKHPGNDQEELNTINRNAQRLLSLTDQLLLFRKIDQGAEDLSLAAFNYATLCRDVFLYFVQEAKAKKISYELVIEEEYLPIVGDRNKIEIILYNLLSNAFKFTPGLGTIRFTVKEDGNAIQTAISDTGAGIPAGTGDKIFDRFYQAAGHGKTGFGIGLYLVKQFAGLHYGQIAYESTPGVGTTFELQLLKGREHFGTQPVAEMLPETKLSEANRMERVMEEEVDIPVIPDAPLISDRKVLLVVDDDAEIRTYITKLFAGQYILYEAVNGAEGLAFARQYNPDLIISDVSMPEMDGIEMCRRIKEDTALSHTPVILLTAITSPESHLQGVEGGADDYVTKPFNNELLVARVNSILKNRNHLHSYFYDQITLKNNDLKVPAEYKEFLDKCMEIVENHLDDEQFTIQVLAREMGMSHSNLYKRIKLISGQSANAFIRFLRLRRSAEMLIDSEFTVNEVTYKVGFSDVKYFREQFNKLFGMNPSEYIKKYRKTLGKNLQITNRNRK
jgi:signal transduction histidine kinase/ligand-binding sensor domain-containing protein/DNA-binding response OmpR family regulator